MDNYFDQILKEDKYGVAKNQKNIFGILQDVDVFCKEKGIDYSLSGGTLLGAVRHKGFIPWDDDADIMFDRKNYKSFLDGFEEAYPNKYRIAGTEWVKRITKISSSEIESQDCVDLFVFDEVPNSRILDCVKTVIIKFIQGTIKTKIDFKRYPFKYRVLLFSTHIIGWFFSLETKLRVYEKVSLWTGEKKQNHKKIKVYNTIFEQLSRTVYQKNILDAYILLDFCGYKFMSIVGYDEYLRVLYGDYMKLPREEDRIPKHI